MENKICKTCQTEKPADDFSPNPKRKGELRDNCKSCANLKGKALYEARKGAGICTTCGKRPAKQGNVRCVFCLDSKKRTADKLRKTHHFSAELEALQKDFWHNVRVEKNVPIPAKQQQVNQWGLVRDFLVSMAIGDSFVVPRRADGVRSYARIQTIMATARRVNLPLLVRKMSPLVDRIWRVAEWPAKTKDKDKSNGADNETN